jgi:hypothetical protein
MSEDELTWEWGCSKCKGDIEGDSKRELRNCDGDTNPNIAWEWMPGLRRCPWSQITDETWVIFRWWRDWKELSALPEGGTDIMEQPAFIVEAIQLCENLRAKVESETLKKQQKASERQHRQSSNNMRRNK